MTMLSSVALRAAATVMEVVSDTVFDSSRKMTDLKNTPQTARMTEVGLDVIRMSANNLVYSNFF